jgi:hypothetical protein
VLPEGLMKNTVDPIGNRTRNLPACSTVLINGIVVLVVVVVVVVVSSLPYDFA